MGILDIFRISQIKEENEQLKKTNADLQNKIDSSGITEYYQAKEKINVLEQESEKTIAQAIEKINTIEQASLNKLAEITNEISSKNSVLQNLEQKVSSLQEKINKLNQQVSSQTKKLSRIKELYKSVDHAISNFFESDVEYSNCKLNTQDFTDLETITPSVILKLHCMDMKDLKKAYKENEKHINHILDQYSARYTTKANKSIYSLMVIALRAELQNILYNLKYEKLDSSIEAVNSISAKYLKIAGEGNQNIAGTLTKFIGEIEYLFTNAVKIEYNYYVKKEQARQEQLAIREQIRQEAEERKALEAERKQIEKEETKYQSEIAKLQDTLNSTSSNQEICNLQQRILELQQQLSSVVLKKEEITSLQNGKAGNVYVISNLGSFGEDVFKVGMTRRLNPQERIDELGSASVPFKFDIHSLIFSEDAVALENKLHNILNNRRLNKVNMRKEFFKIPINELEKLVTSIDPTAEFTRTMAAEEFRQSLSTNEVYSSEFALPDDINEIEEEN